MAVRLLRAALGLPAATPLPAEPETRDLRPPWPPGLQQRHHPCPTPPLPAGHDKDFELAPYPKSTTTLRQPRQSLTTTATSNLVDLDNRNRPSQRQPASGDPFQNRARGARSPQNPEFRSTPTSNRPVSPAPSAHSTTTSNSENGSDSDSPASPPRRVRNAKPADETTRPTQRDLDALWRRYWD